jgi:hypothetical protein
MVELQLLYALRSAEPSYHQSPVTYQSWLLNVLYTCLMRLICNIMYTQAICSCVWWKLGERSLLFIIVVAFAHVSGAYLQM